MGVALVLTACSPAVQPECDPNTGPARADLSCDTAVPAALDALPADHPEITRIQFLYGSAIPCCSYVYPAGEEQPIQGYVVFTYADDASRQFVDVTSWHRELTVGPPTDY